jgi:hypothetical protein
VRTSTICPAYITAVRSQIAAAVVEDGHDLGLGGHVERGGRLVGQQQPRFGEQRGGDHHPLEQAAGELVRILAQAALPVLDADLGQHLDGPAGRLGCPDAQVGAQRLGHEVADPADRVDVRPRILEDHRYLAAVAAQVAPGQRGDVPALEADRPLGRRARGQQAADGPGRHRLAGTGLADQADRLARVDPQPDVAEHGPRPPLDPQPHGQVIDLEQSLGGWRGHRSTSANRRSPSTLNATTTTTMQIPADSAGSG